MPAVGAGAGAAAGAAAAVGAGAGVGAVAVATGVGGEAAAGAVRKAGGAVKGAARRLVGTPPAGPSGKQAQKQREVGPLRWGRALAADAGASAATGAAVAPILAAVDRAVTESAAGKKGLWQSFFGTLRQIGTKPGAFVTSPAFRWLWLVYGGTYFVASAAESTLALLPRGAVSKEAGGVGKWLATSSYNTGSSLAKDTAFARMYGGAASAAAVPAGAYGAWLTRDFLSMAVFFTLPPLLAPTVGKVTGSEESGYVAAQLGLPLAFQAVVTPLHLLGLDIFNRPDKTLAQRASLIRREYLPSTSIRMLRMAPPYSIGTIGLRKLRTEMRRKLGVDLS